jgi:lipoprotein LprG
MAFRRRPSQLGLAIVLAVLAALALASCSDSSASSDDPRELLAEAKRQLDAAPSARFVLTTAEVPTGTASLIGGKGVLARPAKFQGELNVRIGQGTATVSLISVDGDVFAKLPFATTYSQTDPAHFGLGDPGALMDPDKGVSTLLVKATNPKLGEKTRLGSEVLQEVRAKLPGRLIGDLLVNADPAKAVAATFGLAEPKGEVRRVTLVGPFFRSDVNSTLTIVLDRYGEKVTITAPDVASP